MADQKTGSVNINTKDSNAKLDEGIDLLKDSLKNLPIGKNTTVTHKEIIKMEAQGANQTAKNIKKVTDAAKDVNEAIDGLRSNLKEFGKEHYSLSISELLKIKDDDSYTEDAKEMAKNYAKSIEEETKKALGKSKTDIGKSLKESFKNIGIGASESDYKKFVSNYISAISKGVIEGVGGSNTRREMETAFSNILNNSNISSEIKGFAESFRKEIQNALMLSESEFDERKNHFLSNKQKNYKPKYEERFSNGNIVANYFRTVEDALEQFNKAASKQNNPHEILEWGSAFILLGGNIDEVDESIKKLYEDARKDDTNKIFEKMEAGFDQLKQKVEAGFNIDKIVGDLEKVSVKLKANWNEFKKEEDFSSLVNTKKIKDRIKEIDDEFSKGLKDENIVENTVKKFAMMFQEISVYFDEAGKELPKKYENMLSRIADSANANYYAKTGEEKDVNLNKILDDSWYDGYDKALTIFHKAFLEQENFKKQSVTTLPQIDAGSLKKENEELGENTEKWKENTDAINENKKARNESKISSGNENEIEKVKSELEELRKEYQSLHEMAKSPENAKKMSKEEVERYFTLESIIEEMKGKIERLQSQISEEINFQNKFNLEVKDGVEIQDTLGRSIDSNNAKILEGTKLISEQTGQLRVLFHGSNSPDFEKFDPSRVGENSSQFGKGAYFAFDESDAKTFGSNVSEWFANVTKIYKDNVQFSEEELTYIFNEYKKDIQNLFGNIDLDKFLNKMFGKDSFDQLNALTNITNLTDGDLLKKLGYQGRYLSLEKGNGIVIFDIDNIIKAKNLLSKISSDGNLSFDDISKIEKQIENGLSLGEDKSPNSLDETKQALKDLGELNGKISLGEIIQHISDGYKNDNEELTKILETLKLIDKEGNLLGKHISKGTLNSGVDINDSYAIISRKKSEQPIGDIDLLIKKEKEAKEAGIELAQTLAVVDNGNIWYEIQEIAKGQDVHNMSGGVDEFLSETKVLSDMTDEQIIKLYEDAKKLSDLGFELDLNPSNIRYDKDTGFSFIDLSLRNINEEAPEATTIMNTLTQSLMGFVGQRKRLDTEDENFVSEDNLKYLQGMLEIYKKISTIFEGKLETKDFNLAFTFNELEVERAIKNIQENLKQSEIQNLVDPKDIQNLETLEEEINKAQKKIGELWDTKGNESDSDFWHQRIEALEKQKELLKKMAQEADKIPISHDTDQERKEQEKLQEEVHETEEEFRETGEAAEKMGDEIKEGSKIDFTPLLSSLEQIREEITSISKSIGSIDENSGVKNLLAQFDELSQKLNEINEKAGKGVVNLNVGGDDSNSDAMRIELEQRWRERAKEYQGYYESLLKKFGGNEQSLLMAIGGKKYGTSGAYKAIEEYSRSAINTLDDKEKVERLSELLRIVQEIAKASKEMDRVTGLGQKTAVGKFYDFLNEEGKLNSQFGFSTVAKRTENPVVKKQAEVNINGLIDNAEIKQDTADLKIIIETIEQIRNLLIEISNHDLFNESLKESKAILDKIAEEFRELKELYSSIPAVEVKNETPVSSDRDVKKEDTDFEDLLETIRLINQELETKNELILTEASIVNSNISGEVDVFNNLAKTLGKLKTALSDDIFEADKIDQIKTNLKEISNFVQDVNFSNDSIEALNNIINKTDELTKLAQLSSTAIGQENDALKETEKDAKKAANAKGDFTDENKKLGNETGLSAGKIEEEAEAFRDVQNGSLTWKTVSDMAHQYFIELKNIAKIEKMTRSGRNSEGVLITDTAYRITDTEGRQFHIDPNNNFIGTKDVLNVQKVYKDLEKEFDKIYNTYKKIINGDKSSKVEQDLNSTLNKFIELKKLLEKIKEIGLNIPKLDKLIEQKESAIQESIGNLSVEILYKNSPEYKNAQTEIKRARSIEKERQELLYKQKQKIITDDEKGRLDNLNAENALIENAVNGLKEQTEAGRKLKETYEQIKKEAESIAESSVTNQITSDMQKNRDKAQNLLDSGRVLPGSRDSLQNAVNAVNQHLEAGIDSTNITKANGALEKLIQELKEVQKFSDKASLSKLGKKVEKTMNENTAMSRELKGEFDSLSKKIKNLIDTENYDADTVRQLGAEYESLMYKMESAGETGLSFWDRLKNRTFQETLSQISMYFSFDDIINYIANGVETIVELDDALVDLSKTAQMSQKQLDDFYHSANPTAIDMGVTTKEIIEQASAWSRLGYSTDEAATKMAKISSQFASISPGMSTEEAQEGLVSIMKANYTCLYIWKHVYRKYLIAGKA